MFRNRKFLAALTIVALAGGAVGARSCIQKSSAVETETKAGLALTFVPGTTLHYTVAWSGTQRGRLFADGAGAEQTHTATTVDMALAMDLYVESVKGDEAILRMTFPGVERHGLSALGTQVFPTKESATAVLSGRAARLRIGADGSARDVAFQNRSPDMFMNVVQWIVAQSTLSLGPSTGAAGWDASERGPFGRSDVRYTKKSGKDGAELERTRVRYVAFDAFASRDASDVVVKKLEGRTSATLKDGLVQAMHGDESIQIDAKTGATELEGNVAFDMKLVAVDRGNVGSGHIAYGEPTKAGEAVIGDDMRNKLLEQRVEGMTKEQLLADVATMGNGGVMPQHTKWLWRASGLLKKDPAAAKELAKLALAPGATDKSRALVLDLLASAGHAEAQTEMRAILASPELAKSGARPALLQRVSFLETPEPATVDQVWSSLREGKAKGSNDLVAASAHALAATSRAQAKNGDAAGARSTVRKLGAEIAGAKTKEEKASVLSALGNASSEEVTEIAKPYATNDDPELREAAADALRKVPTREAVETLLALLADGNATVQGAALASLKDRELTAGDWQRIAELVAAGRIPANLDGAMLTLAANGLGQVRVVSQIVATIAHRPDASKQTRARAMAMLASAPT